MAVSEKAVLDGVRRELLALATPGKKAAEERFFKEKVNFLGCTYVDINRIVDRCSTSLKREGWTYDQVLALAERLMRNGVYEETAVGLGLVAKRAADFRRSDFATFERWLNSYITNWAHTDTIGPHIVGEMLGMHPELASRVFKWTKSKNRWARRAAAVSYVIHGKRGRFHPQIFRTAEAMYADDDEMVQKGVGWMLKTTSQSDERAVVAFLQKHKRRMPRLVLRYASEKLTPANRKLVMER
ncbi:MAG: DNA alkylation repair protein [Candidatus Aenigmarchaeota archaeon]|nr:DNA alkylation repair protein [Candidatus Aenigmarchaeota archaeon]